MANYTSLKQAIADIIKENGNNEITGQIMQITLTSMVSSLGENQQFAGIAVPTTNPGTVDQNVFYFATATGTYSNFNNINVNNEVAILSNKSGSWVKLNTGFATLRSTIDFISIDSVLPSQYNLESILDFRFSTQANIVPGKSYYIKYAYNNPTMPRFLFQIVDELGVVVSQHYLPNASLTGINKIDLFNGTTNVPFGTVTIDVSKLPQSEVNFGTSIKLNARSERMQNLSQGFIVPGGTLAVDYTGATNFVIKIPTGSRVFNLNFNYTTSAEITITKTISKVSYLIFNRVDNTFSLVDYDSYVDYRVAIILGVINPYNQRQYVYCSRFSVNGTLQDFKIDAGAPYNLDPNAISSQKMADISGNVGRIFKKEINFSNAFPYYGIKSLRVIKADNINDNFYRDGALKEFFLTFVRVISETSTNTLVQIGERVAGDVGVNKNVWVSINTTVPAPQGNLQTLILTNTLGMQVELIIDVSLFTASSYSLTTECPINTVSLLNQALYNSDYMVYNSGIVPKKYQFFLNPKATDFDYNSFMRIEAVEGDYTLLYNTDGTLKELYLTFMRFITSSTIATNIVQIAWKDGSTVGANNKTVATVSGDTRNFENKPIASFELVGSEANGFKGLRFSVIVDISKVPTSYNGIGTIGDKLQLNTLLFVEQLKAANKIARPLVGKKVVCFGDSVTEFGNYPAIIGNLTGATVYKIGFGGCRMGKRSGTTETILAYDELAMYKVAQTVATQDFTAMAAAIEHLKTKPSPDDNTIAFELLKTIDFSTVDLVTIFYGTNDFTSNENFIGTPNSTDVMTIHGSTKSVIETLMTAFPNLRILFITPTHRFFGDGNVFDSDLEPNMIGEYLIDVCDAIEEQANLNHLPALNMYRVGGMNRFNHEYYFGSDGVHPNNIGYLYLGQKFAATLTSIFTFN